MVVTRVFTCVASRVTSCRYFVLDSGYLTYYLDELKEPPYGKDRKGQVCLAGYRVVHSGTPGQGETSSNAVYYSEFQAVSVAVGRGAVCAHHRTSLTSRLLVLRTVLGSMGDEAAPEFQYRIQLALMDTSFQVRV
jgi:hypothetical protein